MRHRVDISPQAKGMLKELAKELGDTSLSVSAITELCIQAAYERVIGNGQYITKDHDPILVKLDEIYSLLQEVLPEV